MPIRRVLPPILCALAGVIATSPAGAEPIQPGDQIPLVGATVAQYPWFGGPAQTATTFVPFLVEDDQDNPVFQGVITSIPSRSDEMGTLRFSYRVRDLQGVGGRRITRIDLLGYEGFQTFVEYRTDGSAGVGPNSAVRAANGSSVGFLFGNPLLLPGDQSRFFFVHTDATHFREDVLARITLNTGETVIVGGLHGPSLSDCPGDTNGDGVINFTDLNTVLSTFGEDCP
jgi:hypothetical protein